MEKFIDNMKDILDTEDEINMNTVLAELDEWDSLSLVSFTAMANATYGKKVEMKKVKECKTVSDLYELVK